MTAPGATAGKKKRLKLVKTTPLPLFPARAPDPLEVPLRADSICWHTGWVCARCLEPKNKKYRTVMVFFGMNERGDLAESSGTNVCTTCASVIRSCLENQTRMTPIHNPPSPKIVPEGASPEAPRLHPWEV